VMEEVKVATTATPVRISTCSGSTHKRWRN
jgi:hypothetical protein